MEKLLRFISNRANGVWDETYNLLELLTRRQYCTVSDVPNDTLLTHALIFDKKVYADGNSCTALGSCWHGTYCMVWYGLNRRIINSKHSIIYTYHSSPNTLHIMQHEKSIPIATVDEMNSLRKTWANCGWLQMGIESIKLMVPSIDIKAHLLAKLYD